MNYLLTLLMILVFPLNSLLFLQGNGAADSGSGAENSKKEAENKQGTVKGAEEEKNLNFLLENTFPIAQIQPIRKQEFGDLDLPNAHSSLILDVESGTILHYQNGRAKRPIASLTKLLTAIIAVEKISNLDEEVVIDEEEVSVEGTKVGCPRSGYCISPRLKVGEKVKAIDLLKAALMNSANDAAIALAKHISGSQEEFAKLMNEKVKELGLKDSHFCTPSGLEIEGKESQCYSSAYDIARIAAYSMRYDVIWEIMRLPSATIVSADGKYSHDIINTNVVLSEVPRCLGGKTGFTPLSGRSLLMGISDPTEKHKVIIVILDDPYRWQDVKIMADWAFKACEWK